MAFSKVCDLWQIKRSNPQIPFFLSVETTYISEFVRLCLYQKPPIESKGLTKQEERQSLKRCHYNFSRTIIPGKHPFKGGKKITLNTILYDFISDGGEQSGACRGGDTLPTGCCFNSSLCHNLYEEAHKSAAAGLLSFSLLEVR